MLARRESAASVGRYYGINESTGKRESNIYARVPASKCKKAHSNPVILILVVVVVVWQLSCRGSYHFLKLDCVADAVPLYQHTHWIWYSFRRPRKDDRLSQPPGVLIQRLTGLELRTLGSQATTLTTEPTPGF